MSWGGEWGGGPTADDLSILNRALNKIGQATLPAFNTTKNGDPVHDLAFDLYPAVRKSTLAKGLWNFATKRTRLTACGLLNCSTKTISFVVNAGADTITDSLSAFITSGNFEDGDLVAVEGSGGNETSYKIYAAGAGTLTLESFEDVTAEVLINDADLKLYAKPAYGYDFKYVRPDDCLKVWAVNNIISTSKPRWAVNGKYIVTSEIDEDDQVFVTYIQNITDPTFFDTLFEDAFILYLCAEMSMGIRHDIKEQDYWNDKGDKKVSEAFLSNTLEDNSDDDVQEDGSWVKAGR